MIGQKQLENVESFKY